ncbi:hypothetical protein EV360DRAFT_67052 [Lentinula raphanica]|nr:hypothetical protein EV360DRAFT_67052 [Lentinula raphanica]
MEHNSDVELQKYYLQLIFDDDTELRQAATSRDQFEDSCASSSTQLQEEILLRPTGTIRSYTTIFNEDDVNCLQFLFESPLSPTSTLSTTTASSDCLATPSDPIFESTCSPDDIFPSDSYRHLENGDASLDLNLELKSDQFRWYHNVYHDLAPWSHSEKGLQEESSSKLPAALNHHDNTKTHDEPSSGSPSFSHRANTMSCSLSSPVHRGICDDWNTTQNVLIPSDPLSPGNHDGKQGVNPALSDNTYPCARSRHRPAKQGISYKGLDTMNGLESDEDYHDGDFGTTSKRKRRSKQQEQLHSRKKANLAYAFFKPDISDFKNTYDVPTTSMEARGRRRGRKGKVEEQFPLDKRAKHCGSRESSSSPRYECELGCGKSFLRRLDRRRHENFSCKLRDSKVPVKEFPCPDCGKTLKRADALQRHIKCVHSDSNGVTGI